MQHSSVKTSVVGIEQVSPGGMVEMIDGWAAAHERQPAIFSPETEAQIKIFGTPSCIAFVELTGL